MPVGDDQILALDQQEAEITGQMRLFGIALVEPAGRQQADAWIGSFAIGGQPPAQIVEKGREPPRVHCAQQIAGRARQSEAVFQRIADPDRRSHPIGQHAPFARRATPDIGGVEMEMVAARRRRAGHHPPIMRAAGDDAGGQLAIAHQRLAPINIADHLFQQFGALGQPLFDMRPFACIDQHRDRSQRPGAFLLVPGQAERHAQVDRLPRDIVRQHRRIALRLGRQPVQHGAPAILHGGRCTGKQIARWSRGQIGVGPGQLRVSVHQSALTRPDA